MGNNNSFIDITDVIQKGIVCDLELGIQLNDIINKKPDSLEFSHEFGDGSMYYYLYNDLVVELLFSKCGLLFSISIRVNEFEIDYKIFNTSLLKITFENLIELLVSNNLGWKFVGEKVYGQVVNIKLDNGLMITYQFKDVTNSLNQLLFLCIEDEEFMFK